MNGGDERWKRRVSKDINPVFLVFNKADWNLEYLKVPKYVQIVVGLKDGDHLVPTFVYKGANFVLKNIFCTREQILY